MKISIIIPVYNTGKYVRKCVESCIHQDMPVTDYEIIVLNDGSTDDSLQVMNQLQLQYPALRIISKENEGLSATRNLGIQLAAGDYIWFIDSDDYIERNVLKRLYTEAVKDDVDALWMRWNRVDESGNKLKDEVNCIQKKIEGVISGEKLLSDVICHCVYAPSFLFRRSFLLENGFQFKKGIHFEDIESIPFLLLKSARTKFLDLAAYNYLQNRAGAITNSMNKNTLNSFIAIIIKYQLYVRENPQVAFYRLLYLVTRLCVSALANKECKADRKEIVEVFKKYQVNRLYFNSGIKNVAINAAFKYFPLSFINMLCAVREMRAKYNRVLN